MSGDPRALPSSIACVESQALGLAPVRALSIAKDLENALLEKQFSKISASVSQEARSMLMDIASEMELPAYAGPGSGFLMSRTASQRMEITLSAKTIMRVTVAAVPVADGSINPMMLTMPHTRRM